MFKVIATGKRKGKGKQFRMFLVPFGSGSKGSPIMRFPLHTHGTISYMAFANFGFNRVEEDGNNANVCVCDPINPSIHSMACRACALKNWDCTY